jgi:hypothetical protein
MSRPPHIIGATHVIAAPVGIIRPIANLNRDAAGIAIAWISAIRVVSASACTNP